MDMKKILQVMDSTGTKSNNSADHDMKRFVSIVAEGKKLSEQSRQVVVEQHVKKPKPIVEQKKTTTSIDQYLKAVEQEITESAQLKQQIRQEKVQKLAKRVIEEQGGNHGNFSKLRTHISRSKKPPENIINMAKSGAKVNNNQRGKMHREETQGVDNVTMDIPLLIRMLEFAREDAKDDMILHKIVEKMIGMQQEGQSLTMRDYNKIVSRVDNNIKEAHGNSKIYDKCWTGYKKVPGKKRGQSGSCVKK